MLPTASLYKKSNGDRRLPQSEHRKVKQNTENQKLAILEYANAKHIRNRRLGGLEGQFTEVSQREEDRRAA